MSEENKYTLRCMFPVGADDVRCYRLQRQHKPNTSGKECSALSVTSVKMLGLQMMGQIMNGFVFEGCAGAFFLVLLIVVLFSACFFVFLGLHITRQ